MACLVTDRFGQATAAAADLTLRLTGEKVASVALVGAFQRWDADGNPRRAVDPRARIDQPGIDAVAQPQPDGTWVFRELAEGRYDLVIVTKDQLRIEGFHYPPVREFDSFLNGNATAPDDIVPIIRKDIAQSRHYENKVAPLAIAGDSKHVRVLVQLVRDEPTSFDGEYGEPVATIRHEFWQYTNRYGGWVKEKRTKVVNRLLLPKREWRQWSWLWEPKLGGVDVSDSPVTLDYGIPKKPSTFQERP